MSDPLPPQLFDKYGKPVSSTRPNVVSGDYCRSVYAMSRDDAGNADLRRALIPHLVVILSVSSPLQIEDDYLEYYVYAQPVEGQAFKAAFRLWERWERLPKVIARGSDDRGIAEGYPRSAGGVVHAITDEEFQQQWQRARNRARHERRHAGNPNDPFAFTVFGNSLNILSAQTFQDGLRVTL